MTREEEDEVLLAVDKLVKFYNRELDDLSKQFWRQWIRTVNDKEELLSAMRKYATRGKFCPKPADIQGIIDENPKKARDHNWNKPLTTDCPQDVSDAWRYFLGKWWNHKIFLARDPLDESEMERWLIIVNKEAKRTSTPEAIPDEYKLQEIWSGATQD